MTKGEPVTDARPGYWDVERCAWVGAEPTHVVPPVPPVPAAADVVAGPAVVPDPRADIEAPATRDPLTADPAAG